MAETAIRVSVGRDGIANRLGIAVLENPLEVAAVDYPGGTREKLGRCG
jgi:hypothetical protein